MRQGAAFLPAMTLHLGHIGKNLVTNGMMVEHDLGKLYIYNMEAALNRYLDASSRKAGQGNKTGASTVWRQRPLASSDEAMLDIIASAIGYSELLQRHIDKENKAIYTFAKKHLPSEVIADVNAKLEAFEKRAEENGFQKKYLAILDGLERSYLDRTA